LGFDLLLIDLLLVDNIGSFDTLRDIGDSFLLSALSLFFSSLDLALKLSNDGGGVSDLLLRGDLLLGGSLDGLLGGRDLSSDDNQFLSVRLNFTGLSGG